MRKSNKIGFWVIRIIGIGLLIGGIIMLVTKINMDVPDVGENGWMDAEASRSLGIFGGVTMIMFGFMMTYVSLIPALKNPNKQTFENNYDNTVEGNGGIVDTIKEITGTKLYHCEYCGSEIPKNSTKCSSCGASRKK